MKFSYQLAHALEEASLLCATQSLSDSLRSVLLPEGGELTETATIERLESWGLNKTDWVELTTASNPFVWFFSGRTVPTDAEQHGAWYLTQEAENIKQTLQLQQDTLVYGRGVPALPSIRRPRS